MASSFYAVGQREKCMWACQMRMFFALIVPMFSPISG